MGKRALVVGALTACLMVAAGQIAAPANVTWCVSDPPVEVLTPGGHYITVNNMLYISVQDRHFARLITDDASATPDGAGGSLVTVHVYIPKQVHGALTVTSDNRYRVSASGLGSSDSVITLLLDIPIN